MFKRFFPIFQWLPTYRKSWLPNDLIAGITVGIILIPQSMAYAMIAGLPPIYGLYSALIPQLMYFFIGTSRHLSVGPVALDSLIVVAGLASLNITGTEEYIATAISLSMLVGGIQIFFGMLRLGFLTNFLSKPVISGFTSAAAIIIALSQLKHLLGIKIPNGNRLYIAAGHITSNIMQTKLLPFAMGVLAIGLLLLCKRFSRKIPGALIVVLLGIVATYLFQWHDQLGIVGEIPQGLPKFAMPILDFSKIIRLLPVAVTLAFLGYTEAFSIGKSVEEKQGTYQIVPNQELLALGFANVLGSLFQSYPSAASFSRTAINHEAKARTGVSSLVSVILVALTLLFLTPLFYYLPSTVLAAIIMVAVFGLFDLEFPKKLFKLRRDEFWLWCFTFIATLALGIVYGILMGVLMSLILMVYRVSNPHIAILGRIKGTDYFKNVNRFADDIQERDDLLVLRFDAQLFFGNKDYFKKELFRYIENKGDALKAIILNAEAITYIDSSALNELTTIVKTLHERDLNFIMAGAIGPLRDILFKSGLAETIGKDNLFVRTFEAVDHYDGTASKQQFPYKISQQAKA